MRSGKATKRERNSARRQEASSDAVARAGFRLSLADHTAAAKVCGAKRFATGGLPAFLSGGNLVLDARQKQLCSRIQGRGTRSRVHRSGPPSGPSAIAVSICTGAQRKRTRLEGLRLRGILTTCTLFVDALAPVLHRAARRVS